MLTKPCDACYIYTSWRQEAATICPRPCTLHAAAQLRPIHALRLACGAQCALLPVAESTLNILYVHDICQTDVRQHYCLMPPPRGQGHNNRVVRCAAELLRISYFQKGSRLSSWIFLFSQFLWKTEISSSCKNLVKIGRCTAKLLRMFTFQNGGRPPSWIGMTS